MMLSSISRMELCFGVPPSLLVDSSRPINSPVKPGNIGIEMGGKSYAGKIRGEFFATLKILKNSSRWQLSYVSPYLCGKVIETIILDDQYLYGYLKDISIKGGVSFFILYLDPRFVFRSLVLVTVVSQIAPHISSVWPCLVRRIIHMCPRSIKSCDENKW